MLSDYIQDKTVMITGGTGSFGHKMTVRLLSGLEPRRIIIFSRDEKKQADMKYEFEGLPLDFIVGDVRDAPRIREAMQGVDVVYHAAALKQVPNCENHPMEAVKTNVLGAENVRRAALRNNVERLIAISTDKAVKPINVMGMSKAIQERLFLNRIRPDDTTIINVVRYGNILGSRGSIIPFFIDLIRAKKPLTITHPYMTRFLLTLDDAIDLVFRATISNDAGQLFVKKSPAAFVETVANVVGEIITGKLDYPSKIVGIRPGEKMHETLISEDEMRRVDEEDDFYIVFPHSTAVHKERGEFEYTSDQTKRLDHDELSKLLQSSGPLII